MVNKLFKRVFLIILYFIFSGCDSSSTNSSSVNSIAYLIDANRVSGVEYECSNDNISGITTKEGKFEYSQNCNKLTFKLGTTVLASIYIDNISLDDKLYTTDLVGVDRDDTNNTKVKNISRILQTLDEDNNPCNGIDINSTIRSNIINYVEIQNSFSTQEDLENLLIDADILPDALVSPIKALVHLERTLRADNIYVDTVPPYRPELDKSKYQLPSGKYLIKYENNITTIATAYDSDSQMMTINFLGEGGK